MRFIKSQDLLEQTQALVALAHKRTFLVKGLGVVCTSHKSTLAVKVCLAPAGFCNATDEFAFAVSEK